MTQKDTAPMLRGVSKDAGPGLWGWTPMAPPNLSLMSTEGVLRVLVRGSDVLPGTLVMATGGASRA